MAWYCRWHFPSPGMDSCICSRLFSILGVWLWFGLQLRLELVLKVSRLGLGLGLVLVGLDVVWGWKIAPVMYICQSWMESNTKRLDLGFQVFYSVLLQTTLRSSAPLSKRSSTTVSVWVNSAAVRRRLTSSTMFCIHGWSSGAGYTALNHRRSCFRLRRSTILEQSSSRSAPIPDIYYFQNTLEVTSVQLIFSFSLTVSLTIFVQSPWSLCCIRHFKFVIIRLHYITFSEQHYGYV